MAETFGDRIRRLAAERRISHAELCRRMGMSRSHLSRILNGALSPNHRTVARLAEGLGVDTRVVLGGAELDFEVPARLRELVDVCRHLKVEQIYRILHYARYERDTTV